MNKEKINKALRIGYSLNVLNYIDNAWSIFRKGPSLFIALLIISMLLSFFTGFIPYLEGIVHTLFINPFILLGYSILAHKIRKQEGFEFENAFNGYKRFFPIALTTLIKSALTLIVLFPVFGDIGLGLVLEKDFNSALELADLNLFMICSTLIILYILIALRWTEMLIYFFNYSPIDALRTSLLLVNKNIGVHLAIFISMIVITLLGVLVFIIGILVAIPLCYIFDYLIFEEVTGLLEENESDDGDLFYDQNEGYL